MYIYIITFKNKGDVDRLMSIVFLRMYFYLYSRVSVVCVTMFCLKYFKYFSRAVFNQLQHSKTCNQVIFLN